MDSLKVEVSATGTAEATFTKATFTVRADTTDPIGSKAKVALRPIIEAIRTVITDCAEKAKIDLTQIKTTAEVTPISHINHVTGEKTFHHYRAAYTATFSAKNVIEAIAVHDRLTNIPGVSADSPVFHVDNNPEIVNHAFKDAYDKAIAKFEAQCKTVGLESNKWSKWHVTSWTIHEERSGGKSLSFNENRVKPDAVGIEPGKATLTLNVYFLFEFLSV